MSKLEFRRLRGGSPPESNIRGKLNGKVVFFGVAPNQKNGGKNFGGGKQEGNSLREVWERPALKTLVAENRGVICFGKCVATPESNIRGKLDGKAVFSGLPQTKKTAVRILGTENRRVIRFGNGGATRLKNLFLQKLRGEHGK